MSSKEVEILEKKLNLLNKGDDKLSDNKEENIFLSSIGLLSIKPRIIVCNVDEASLAKGNDYSNKVIENYPDEKVVIICADIEDQIMNLDKSEQVNFMNEVGMEKTGLNQLIKTGYDLLNLETFFTSGPLESRAWTVKKNTLAPKAASVIHTDFEKKFY